ncbi:glycosyltransferase involved in cell wall biosynthesis [Agromyces cerinus]|uniref:glycosyltransferase n=1 Tax=Agromyces cerinus TaxID=33878 RepID=UPI00195D2088|nr:glycosyltransferase [Agromyces cerinus]MBM7830022.1 glycosyltransferase involved in cell wall biosynthesis [Agromyces cerinus]
MSRPRILCISFSHFLADSRVLRQLKVLERFGDVTTVGYGAAPEGVAEHLEIDASLPSLPQTVGGVAKLAVRAYRSVEFDAPAVRRAKELIGDRSFDLVVANEARALPLAHHVAAGAPVWGDMHEWAPQERTHVLSWRLLVAPFMTWVCREYLPRTAAVSTINGSIAELYEREFGVRSRIVRNAIDLQPLAPSPLAPDRIRLVHSGGAVPGRSIETLIEATKQLDERFTLDLYLVKARGADAYWQSLVDSAAASDRITVHDPVAPAELPSVLNAFDVGVFVLPPRTMNHRLMLPNKFFDMVQARLALVFSTAVETDALIERFDLGRISPGFGVAELVEALSTLTHDDVARFKANADIAAATLNSAEDERVEAEIITSLLAR